MRQLDDNLQGEMRIWSSHDREFLGLLTPLQVGGYGALLLLLTTGRILPFPCQMGVMLFVNKVVHAHAWRMTALHLLMLVFTCMQGAKYMTMTFPFHCDPLAFVNALHEREAMAAA